MMDSSVVVVTSGNTTLKLDGQGGNVKGVVKDAHHTWENLKRVHNSLYCEGDE